MALPFLDDLRTVPINSHTPDGKVEIDQSGTGLLGCGAHGTVRVGHVVESGEVVAVKVCPLAESLKSSAKELTALSLLPDHPHVVKVHSALVNVVDGVLYMVLELCRGGELFDRIAESGGMAEDEARHFFTQIVSAIDHCHASRVYHRDLKPENILLDANDRIKVADFGLASTRSQEERSAAYLQRTRCGSLSYAAPEIHHMGGGASSAEAGPGVGAGDAGWEGYDPEKADVWSLGVVLYCMVTARLPFDVARADVCPRYAAVEKEGIAVMCPDDFSDGLVALLDRMLRPDPTQRPTARQLTSDGWLAGAKPKPDPAAPAVPPCTPAKWSEALTYELDASGGRRPRWTQAVGGVQVDLEGAPGEGVVGLATGGDAEAPRLMRVAGTGEEVVADAGTATAACGPPLGGGKTWDLLAMPPSGTASGSERDGSRRRRRTGDGGATAPGAAPPDVTPPDVMPAEAQHTSASEHKGLPASSHKRAKTGGAQDAHESMVNDLVRHLGWERLDGSAVDLMASVVESLDKMGVKYAVDRQSRTVRMSGQQRPLASPGQVASASGPAMGRPQQPPSAGDRDADGEGGDGEAVLAREARVTIQLVRNALGAEDASDGLALAPDAGTDSLSGMHNLNFIRQSGCTIAFHSLYQEFRSQMSLRNGWEAATNTYVVPATKT